LNVSTEELIPYDNELQIDAECQNEIADESDDCEISNWINRIT